MAVTQIDLESKAIELAAPAFDRFCEDISGMFGVDIKCVPQKPSIETIDSLKKRFKKLSAINNVDAEGAIHGTFYLIFDQGGLFTLSGIIVMLPEKRILEEIKRGTVQDVNSMNDAVRETGNLCVGSWDRIFREEYTGHGHFVQNGTFIGNPWDKPEESIRLRKDESLSFVPFEMTIGSYPVFNCGVIFPKSIFALQSELPAEKSSPAEDKVENKDSETSPVDNKEKDLEIIGDAKKVENEENKPAVETEKTLVQTESVPVNNPVNQDENSVSETIKRMTQSPAVLPGQPVSGTLAPDESNHISLSLCAKDIMDKNVTWCSPDAGVQQAIEKMQQFDTGYLMIGSANVPEGIVSRSDITGAVSPYLRAIFSKWRRPLDDATLSIRIKWIMSRPVHTIKPETTITRIMENMCQHGVRCLPVINQKGNVEGMVTVFDIFRALNANADISTMGKTIQVPLLL
ncbi:MAG: CBS domain-containing protein [Sedimentisphaerales bacterium]|nr:CBS domain-containing protein [Sedimentisphaerales bacterium]